MRTYLKSNFKNRIRGFVRNFGVMPLALSGLTLTSGTGAILVAGTGATLTAGDNCYVDILHQIGPINLGLSIAESQLRQAQRAIDAALEAGCITEERRTEIDNQIQAAATRLVNLQDLVEAAAAALDACFEKGGITPSFYAKGQQWVQRCLDRIQAGLDLGYQLGFEILPEIPTCE